MDISSVDYSADQLPSTDRDQSMDSFAVHGTTFRQHVIGKDNQADEPLTVPSSTVLSGGHGGSLDSQSRVQTPWTFEGKPPLTTGTFSSVGNAVLSSHALPSANSIHQGFNTPYAQAFERNSKTHSSPLNSPYREQFSQARSIDQSVGSLASNALELASKDTFPGDSQSRGRSSLTSDLTSDFSSELGTLGGHRSNKLRATQQHLRETMPSSNYRFSSSLVSPLDLSLCGSVRQKALPTFGARGNPFSVSDLDAQQDASVPTSQSSLFGSAPSPLVRNSFHDPSATAACAPILPESSSASHGNGLPVRFTTKNSVTTNSGTHEQECFRDQHRDLVDRFANVVSIVSTPPASYSSSVQPITVQEGRQGPRTTALQQPSSLAPSTTRDVGTLALSSEHAHHSTEQTVTGHLLESGSSVPCDQAFQSNLSTEASAGHLNRPGGLNGESSPSPYEQNLDFLYSGASFQSTSAVRFDTADVMQRVCAELFEEIPASPHTNEQQHNDVESPRHRIHPILAMPLGLGGCNCFPCGSCLDDLSTEYGEVRSDQLTQEGQDCQSPSRCHRTEALHPPSFQLIHPRLPTFSRHVTVRPAKQRPDQLSSMPFDEARSMSILHREVSAISRNISRSDASLVSNRPHLCPCAFSVRKSPSYGLVSQPSKQSCGSAVFRKLRTDPIQRRRKLFGCV